MLNLLIKLIEKIVFSGVNGTILILPIIILLWFMFGQAKDCIKVVRKVWEEEKVTSNR